MADLRPALLVSWFFLWLIVLDRSPVLGVILAPILVVIAIWLYRDGETS